MSDGVFLPAELAKGTQTYILELEQYPKTAQAAMDAMADVYQTQLVEQHSVLDARAQETNDISTAKAAHVRVGTFLGIAIPSAALGVIAGFLLRHKLEGHR